MKKKVFFTTMGVIALIGILGGIKGLQIGRMAAHSKQAMPPPETVSTAMVQADSWESVLSAVGSLEAVQGVTVTSELTGKVVEIAFEPGSKVRAGDLLVRQDTSSEEAQLRSAEADLSLAKITLDRNRKLLPRKVISQADYDDSEAKYKQARAQVENIRAVIAKKTIRAPFSGRLGIRLVNLGQIIDSGTPIVSLQSLNPIHVNFLMPQQYLSRLDPGLRVKVKPDSVSEQEIEGRITAINPEVDAATRNIRLQATVNNPDERLRPGMFVEVAVVMPQKKEVLAIPATSILYAPYSDSVFVLEQPDTTQSSAQPGAVKVVRQQFVRLGEMRGDFISIVEGLREGQVVVSTGVFKLRNGQTVVVNNSIEPEFKLSPKPSNS
jgi:membrane fusion protein (multidrug efflux system)